MDFSLDEKQLSFKKALINIARRRLCLQGLRAPVQYHAQIWNCELPVLHFSNEQSRLRLTKAD
jgi:hypothetical protein